MGYELNKLLNLYGVRSATQEQYAGADDPGAPPEVPDDLYAHLPTVTGPKSEYEDSILRHFTPDERRNYLLNQQKMGIDPTQSYTDADGEIVDLRETYTDIFPVYAPQPGDPNYDSYMDYQKSVEEYLPRKEEFDYDQEQYNAYVDEWNNRMLETDIYRDRQFAGLTPSRPVDGPNPPYFPGPIVPFQGDSTQGMGEITSPGGPSSIYMTPGWDQGRGTQWDSPLNNPVYQKDIIPPYVPPVTFPEAPVIPPVNGDTVVEEDNWWEIDDTIHEAHRGGSIKGYQQGDLVTDEELDIYGVNTNPYGRDVEEDLFFNEVEVGGPQRQTTLDSLQKPNPMNVLLKTRINELRKRQERIGAIREKEIELLRQIHDIKKSRLSSGSNAEFYFKLGEAFSKPTRTGNFFESLGNVSGVLAEDAKAKRRAQGEAQLGELQLQRDILKLGRDDITAADKLDTTIFGLEKADIQANAPKELDSIDKKELSENLKQIAAGKEAIKSLQEAKKYNENSYSLGNWWEQAAYWKEKKLSRGKQSDRLRNTENLLSVVQRVVLAQLKATFGARPSDAELRELQKTLGLEASSAEVRKSIFDSNIAQVNRKIEELELRNSELKSQ